MIIKKINCSNWFRINKYIGIEAAATNEEREENFEIPNVTNQEIINTIPK